MGQSRKCGGLTQLGRCRLCGRCELGLLDSEALSAPNYHVSGMDFSVGLPNQSFFLDSSAELLPRVPN